MAELQLVVDGAEIHVETEGEGLPVVLVHGLGLQGSLWDPVCEALDPGYRLVRIDLRGSPLGRELERSDLSLGRWAADLGAVVKALELDRPVIVGHSLGAAVALRFALDRPHDLRALVLIGAEADLSNLAPRMLASAERIESSSLEAWIEDAWVKKPPFSEQSLQRNPEILGRYRQLLLENDADDYVRQCRAIATAESLSDRLAEVSPPTLVIIGGSDDRTLPEHGRELARRVPGARLVELPDVGHTIPFEAPEATAEAIEKFIAEVDAEANGGARILRADTTPRNSREGPFGHLDVRWVVGEQTGSSLIAFGQSTYPHQATHENHFHPNAEEVVMVVVGRGTQIVGDRSLDLGPGDICFIPRGTPHRITGTSDEEDLVILWAFGGAASIEQAGYVPLPD